MGTNELFYNNVEKSVDAFIKKLDKNIVMGMPLALGKPTRFINELYRRAKEDPEIKLIIMTALALEKPKGKSEIEKRLLGPLVDRVFEGTPDFDYMIDLRAGKLPKNVSVYEFFNKAGGYMHTPVAQKNHLNSNYTHVIRDAVDLGVNSYAMMISTQEVDGKLMCSMSCNPDISLEAVRELRILESQGKKVAVVGEINENLPFMYGDAVVTPETYDIIINDPKCTFPLFGPPKDAVSLRDHMIGLHVSTLLKDGGTIQVGIGALGDAIVAGLEMRHLHNEAYNEVIEKLEIKKRYEKLIDRIGGTGTFEEGLYGSSEMFVDAFMQLYKSGILKRKVFDSIPLMELINEKKIGANNIPENILDLLHEKKAIHQKLTSNDFDFLTEFGILKEGLKYNDYKILDGKTEYSADLTDKANKEAIKKLLGSELKKPQVIFSAFFLGPRNFYQALNDMPEEERKLFGMSGVDKVNQLYGGEELRALQRKEGRFVNAGMMANVFGAITSDQLEDGRVVSGIGGQYNFVSMAHALRDGRLIMMIKSTRNAGLRTASNILYSYGHCSVPKHLRDIIVTEYGIANIRGLPDKAVIAEMLNITDSRYQDELLARAKKEGKISERYEIPEKYRNNYPEKYEAILRPYQEQGYFKVFPFGTDIMDEEVVLAGSLKAMIAHTKLYALRGLLFELFKCVPKNSLPYLKRMGLESPSSIKEKLMQKVVLFALRANKKI